MRKLLSFLVLFAGAIAAPLVASAQLNPQPAWQYASDYGQWVIVSQAPQTYTWSGSNVCQVPKPGGGTFFPFTTSTPVFVRDALNPTHNEIVTVTAPVNTTSSCGFTGSFTYTHTSFSILSATGGVQEALNVLDSTTQPSPVGIILNRNWYALLTGLPGYTTATPGTIISSLTGTTSAYLIDVTTAPWTYYTWNGTAYRSAGGSLPPTPALSTGAGTTPTGLTITGNGSSGTVSFTAGTSPTASATIFTLTWPVTAAGGFNHAPSCTITSVGVNAYTSGTTASVYTPPARETFTASATALTASTPYSFAYSCL